MKRIGRLPGDDVAQLEEKHGDNDRRADHASHHQTGCERKASEPATHRTCEDELRNAPDRDAEDQPIQDAYFYPTGEVKPRARTKPIAAMMLPMMMAPAIAAFSLKPRVHAASSHAPTRTRSIAFRYHCWEFIPHPVRTPCAG